jgi:hypothetical protein
VGLTVLWALGGAIAGPVVGHVIFDDFRDERLPLLGIVGAGFGAFLGSLKYSRCRSRLRMKLAASSRATPQAQEKKLRPRSNSPSSFHRMSVVC